MSKFGFAPIYDELVYETLLFQTPLIKSAIANQNIAKSVELYEHKIQQWDNYLAFRKRMAEDEEETKE